MDATRKLLAHNISKIIRRRYETRHPIRIKVESLKSMLHSVPPPLKWFMRWNARLQDLVSDVFADRSASFVFVCAGMPAVPGARIAFTAAGRAVAFLGTTGTVVPARAVVSTGIVPACVDNGLVNHLLKLFHRDAGNRGTRRSCGRSCRGHDAVSDFEAFDLQDIDRWCIVPLQRQTGSSDGASTSYSTPS